VARPLIYCLLDGTLARVSKDVFRGNLEQARIEAALHEIEDRIIIERQATTGRDATVISIRQYTDSDDPARDWTDPIRSTK
jgi:hypothetical protein